MPYGKPAVAKCADCGSAICSDCCVECCGESFRGQCYEYHVANSWVRKPVQYERYAPSDRSEKPETDEKITASWGQWVRIARLSGSVCDRFFLLPSGDNIK